MVVEQWRQEIANRYFPKGGQVFVDHTGPLLPARSFFENLGVYNGKLDRVVTADNTWVPSAELREDFYDASPQRMYDFLRGRLRDVYYLTDQALTTLRPGGFNLHGETHIDWVTSNVRTLLQSAGASRLALVRGISAARGHDLGNFASRPNHATLSPEVFTRCVPEITSNAQNWEIIERAILLHGADDFKHMLPGWERMSAEEKIAAMIEFGPEANALIIADKADIGRRRVNSQVFDVSEYDIDPHTEVNLLGYTESIRRTKKNNLRWEMEFAPGMTPEEREKYPHLSKERSNHDGIRARASAASHAIYRENQIPHFDAWKNLLWEVYLEGIERVIISSFALFPNLKAVIIRMSDGEAFTAIESEAKRGRVDEFMEAMRQEHVKKEVRLGLKIGK